MGSYPLTVGPELRRILVAAPGGFEECARDARGSAAAEVCVRKWCVHGRAYMNNTHLPIHGLFKGRQENLPSHCKEIERWHTPSQLHAAAARSSHATQGGTVCLVQPVYTPQRLARLGLGQRQGLVGVHEALKVSGAEAVRVVIGQHHSGDVPPALQLERCVL